MVMDQWIETKMFDCIKVTVLALANKDITLKKILCHGHSIFYTDCQCT